MAGDTGEHVREERQRVTCVGGGTVKSNLCPILYDTDRDHSHYSTMLSLSLLLVGNSSSSDAVYHLLEKGNARFCIFWYLQMVSYPFAFLSSSHQVAGEPWMFERLSPTLCPCSMTGSTWR